MSNAAQNVEGSPGPDGGRPRGSRFLASATTCVAIFAIALGVRLVYLHQIRTLPLFDTLVGDAAGYDRWATQIVAGDWFGNETFYQAPAYPYFLAAVYRVFGRDPYTVRVVQAVLGAVAAVMVALATRAFLSPRRRAMPADAAPSRNPNPWTAGVVAGVMVAFYPPAIFFDGLIQKAALDMVFMAALLWRLGVLVHRPRWWGWLVAGLLLGLLALTRENALVLLAVLAFWPWFGRWEAWNPAFGGQGRPNPEAPANGFAPAGWSSRLVWTAALAAGTALVLAPVAWRNWRVGGEFVITTVQAGPNFYIGNHAGATGRYVPLVRGHESPPFERADATRLAEQAAGRPLTGREVSRYWLGQAGAYIRNNPGAWLVLLGKKLLLTLNAYEITDVEGYYLYRDYAPLLGVLGRIWHFGVLFPLAVAGAVLVWPTAGRQVRGEASWRAVKVLVVMFLVLTASVALFYVLARYRYPLAPLLVPLAAAAVVEGGRAWRAGAGRRLAAPGLALVACAVLGNLRVNPERQLNAMAYANLGTVLAQRGDLAPAAEVLRIALEDNPDTAEVRYNLGLVYLLQEAYPLAVAQFEAAKKLDPALIELDYQLGVAYEYSGDPAAALRCYRAALVVNPGDNEARQAIGRLGGG